MYYFKDLNSLEIVTRKHQINSEALDGLIEPVGEDLSYVIAHIPNKKMGWDLKPIEILPADEAFDKVKVLGKDVINGRPFYRTVIKEDLKEYVKLNENYTLISDKVQEKPEPIKSREVIKNKETPALKDRPKKSSNNKIYQPVLQRDRAGEKPLRRS
jgi:dihydrofolate reductase